MENYCGECGRKMDEKTGLCPYCDKKTLNAKKNKKIIKAVVAIVCSISIIVGGVFGALLIVRQKNIDEAISKGDLLVLISESFGMYSYADSTPHTDTVKSDDAYFPYVQMAYEWGLISDKKFDVNEKATNSFLSETLVKCVGIVDTSDMTRNEIANYASENNYVSFSHRGFLDNILYVTKEEVQKCIDMSVSVWTDRQFETKEEITYVDEVLDLSESVASSQVFVDEESKTITIPEDAAKNIKSGTTFILPANNIDTTKAAYKAQKIESSNGIAMIKYEDAEIEDTINDLSFSGSTEVDFNKVLITDGAGNLINNDSVEGVSTQSLSPKIENAALITTNDYDIVSCAKGKISFSIDGLTVSGSISSNSLSFSIEGDLLNKNDKKTTLKKSYTISDLSADYDYKIEKRKFVSAYAKLNYTVKDNTSISFSCLKAGNLFLDQRKKPTLNNILKSEFRSSATEKGAKTIKICSFPIVNYGIGRLDLDVQAKISASGSVELIITTNNAKGLEYKNGNIRYINDQSDDKDVNIKAKIEATLYLGFAVKVLKLNLLGVGIEGGIGAEISIVFHLVNSDNIEIDSLSLEDGNLEYVNASLSYLQNMTYDENGKTFSLHIDTCGNLTVYMILKIKIADECALAKILDAKSVKFEIEIFGKDNATIEELSPHIEDWKIVDECTRKYDGSVSVDTDEDKTEDVTPEEKPENNSPSVLSSEDAVDIYMQQKDVWGNVPEYTPMYGYGYCLLDLDFDGVLELIRSECDGSGRFSNNKFYRINTNSLTVEEIQVVSGHEDYNGLDYYYKADSISLLKNSTSGKMFYDVPDYVHVSMSEHGEYSTECYMENGILYEDYWISIYYQATTGNYTNKTVQFYGKYVGLPVTPFSEVEQTIYEYMLENTDMDLSFDSINGQDFADADNAEKRTMLLDAYRSFSYDGFSFGDRQESNQPSATNLDAYKDVLKEHTEYNGYIQGDYVLYDINKNGSPELIIRRENTHYYVYTIDGGSVQSCLTSDGYEYFTAYQNALYEYDGNGMVVYNGGLGSMRAERLSWYMLLENNEIIWYDDFLTTELGATYQEISDAKANLTPIDDFYLITDYTLLETYQ